MTTKTIKPSGGDYTTLSAWQASLSSPLAAPQQADIYNFGSGGLIEGNGVSFNGMVTDATNKIILNVPVGERHTGVAHSGAYITNGAGSVFTTLRFGSCDYYEIAWLEVEALNAQSAIAVGTTSSGANQAYAHHCIVHNNGANNWNVTSGNGIHIWRNNFIYTNSSGRMCDSRGCASIEVSACTFLSQSADFNFLGDTAATVKNSYSGGASSGCWQNSGSMTGNNNASSDTSATTIFTSSLASKAASAVLANSTGGSEDLTLKTGTNDLVDAGVTQAAITDDIIGTSRPQGSTPDIGGFERASGGGGGSAAPLRGLMGVGR